MSRAPRTRPWLCAPLVSAALAVVVHAPDTRARDARPAHLEITATRPGSD